ncbi:hypothetical protein FB45DRAFT_1022546 [Roridomyces roridus]|uniref:Uncharacterized protein n=1 Tax=Roridomyces roridus TaxID=1738132 RepID=A0AAD7C899_9AGAR|nr:hypothetical protein FB45DRAFT_1022546 [Roridomyces roridus]
MQSFKFWSRPTTYEPVAQDEFKLELESQSPSASHARANQSPWLQRALLLLALSNLLLAFIALLSTRGLSRNSTALWPVKGKDVSALPRPDPYIGLHLNVD